MKEAECERYGPKSPTDHGSAGESDWSNPRRSRVVLASAAFIDRGSRRFDSLVVLVFEVGQLLFDQVDIDIDLIPICDVGRCAAVGQGGLPLVRRVGDAWNARRLVARALGRREELLPGTDRDHQTRRRGTGHDESNSRPRV